MGAALNELAPACRGFEKTDATRLEAVSAPGYGIHSAGRSSVLAFSEDGALLHAGLNRSSACGVATFRLSDGREQGRFSTPGRAVAFSRDRQLVASQAVDFKVTVLNVADGGGFAAFFGAAAQFVFSDDGKRLHGASGQRVTTWSLPDGKEIARNEIEVKMRFNAMSIVVTHDEASNITGYWGGDRTAVVFYLREKNDFRTFERQVPMALAMHPTKDLVAIAGYGEISIVIFDAQIAQRLHEMKSNAPFSSVAFSPDGALLAGGSFKRACVFDAETGEQRFLFEGFRGPVTRVAISRDGILAAGCDDHALRLFDLTKNGAELILEPDGGGHRGPVRWLAFDDTGRLHSGAEPGHERVADESAEISSLNTDGAAWKSPVHIAWDPSTLAIAEVIASGLTAPKRPSGLSVPAPTGHLAEADLAALVPKNSAIVRSPNGRHWLSIDPTGTLHLWLLAAEKPLAEWRLDSAADGATAAVFSPDGARLYVGSERGVLLAFAIESTG